MLAWLRQLFCKREVRPLVAEPLRAVTVREGDTLALMFKEHLSMETADRIKAQCNIVWPGRKVIVLGGGAQIAAIRFEDGPNAHPLTESEMQQLAECACPGDEGSCARLANCRFRARA